MQTAEYTALAQSSMSHTWILSSWTELGGKALWGYPVTTSRPVWHRSGLQPEFLSHRELCKTYCIKEVIINCSMNVTYSFSQLLPSAPIMWLERSGFGQHWLSSSCSGGDKLARITPIHLSGSKCGRISEYSPAVMIYPYSHHSST